VGWLDMAGAHLAFAVHYLNQMWIFLSFTFSQGAAAQPLFAANVAHVVTRPLIGPLVLQRPGWCCAYGVPI